MGTADTSEQSVLGALFEGAALTRPELVGRTGLSAPTISEAVRRLVDAGLVVDAGVRRGRPGRVPTYYRLASTAGYVIGVDIGGDNLRIAAADLAGVVHLERRQAATAIGARRVASQVARMIAGVVRVLGRRLGPLRRIGVATPGAIHPDGRTMSLAWNLGEEGSFDLLTPLEARVPAPVLLDNNVNLAALGERWRGHARGVDTFAFLAVGAGIGMGLIHNGEPVRGAHGAAGEVAYLPLPGAVPPAQRVGRAAVFDPELVVLGGGVGSNPLLLPTVRETVGAYVPFAPRIETSALGEVASLTGAVFIALVAAQTEILRTVGPSSNG